MTESNDVAAPPLTGISVLITRPLHQAQRTARIIEAAGGEAIVFPTIAIEPLQGTLDGVAERIDEYDMAIFVSANAVGCSVPYLVARCRIPATLIFAAIGEATQKALLDCGINSVLAPEEQYDSEALLALPPMRHVAGKRIVIFHGEGGRQVLASSLRERRAQVDSVVCYRRVRPQQDASLVGDRWRRGSIDAVSALSWESVQNLYQLLDEETRPLLAHTPVLVPHSRIAEAAIKLGLKDIRVTGAGDGALIESLKLCSKS